MLPTKFIQVACRVLLFLSVSSSGWSQEQKGVGEVTYTSRPTTADHDSALNAALTNAIDAWIAEKHPSHYKNYQKARGGITAKLNEYVLSHQIISEDNNKEAKRLRKVVRANLNGNALLHALLQPSEDIARSYLTFVFVAREQNAGATGIDMANKDVWNVSTSREIDSAMGQVFTDASYQVIDASLVGDDHGRLDIYRFIDDFKKGDDIGPEAKREAYAVLSALPPGDEIQYFAIGALDVEASAIDSVTGNIRVAVAVTGEVWDISKRGVVVAKVGPVTMSGEGSSELVARNNALTSAARQAAATLVAQLSSKIIR